MMDSVVMENTEFIMGVDGEKYKCFINEAICGKTMMWELTVRKLVKKKFIFWFYWGTEWVHRMDLHSHEKELKYHHDSNNDTRYFYIESLKHIVPKAIDDYHRERYILKKDADKTKSFEQIKY